MKAALAFAVLVVLGVSLYLLREAINGEYDRISKVVIHESRPSTICTATEDDPETNISGAFAPSRTNNLLGIKYSRDVEGLASKNGIVVKNSGIPASDGGTWAEFQTADDSLKMMPPMLRGFRVYYDPTYPGGDGSIDHALRVWSNCKENPTRCYGAEILKGAIDPKTPVLKLTDDEMQQVVLPAAARTEGVAHAAALKANPPRIFDYSQRGGVESAVVALIDRPARIVVPDRWPSHWNLHVEGQPWELTYCLPGDPTPHGPYKPGDQIPFIKGKTFRAWGKGEITMKPGLSSDPKAPVLANY